MSDQLQVEPASASRPSYKSASIWALAGTGSSQAIRFVNNLVLWRLLFPEAFGVMAIVNSLLIALQMFSDVGVAASIVQNPRGEEPRFLRTAWTIQVIRGLVLGVVVVLLAPFVAAFYDAPELANYIRVSGFSAIIQGLTSTRLRLRTRNVDIRSQVFVEVVSQILAAIFTIGWALISPSVWALVVGGVVGVATQVLLSHFVLRGTHRDSLGWDRDCAKDLFTFGKWVFVSTLLTFAAMQSDRLLFGKLISLAELGAYSIGQGLATLPSQVLGRMGSTVIFPLLSRAQSDFRALAETLARTRMPLLLLSAWMCSGLITAGPSVVAILYGERAQTATWVVAVLASGVWALALRLVYDSTMLATGQPRWTAMTNAAKVAGMVMLIPLGFVLLGFPGAVAGYAASEFAGYAVGAIAAQRKGWFLARQDVLTTLGMIAVCSVGWLIRLEARSQEWPLILEAAINSALVTGFWGVLFVLQRRRRLDALFVPSARASTRAL